MALDDILAAVRVVASGDALMTPETRQAGDLTEHGPDRREIDHTIR